MTRTRTRKKGGEKVAALIPKKNDYRKIYKDYYGVEFGSDMVIHHIDFNHSNNNIDNLLLLPREIHCQYHTIMTHLGANGTGDIGKVLLQFDGKADKGTCFRTLSNVLDSARKWIAFKKFLDVHMPTAILFASATCDWVRICTDLYKIIPSGTKWAIHSGKLRIGRISYRW